MQGIVPRNGQYLGTLSRRVYLTLGEFESLNVSVATGIALFEAVRQRVVA